MPYPTVAGGDQPYGPLVTFRTQEIFPPSAVYVGADDALHFTCRTPEFNGTAQLMIRFLTPQGEIHPELYTLPCVQSTTTDSEIHIPHAEGFILSAVITSTATSRGRAFFQFKLHRGASTSQIVFPLVLLQGYVTAFDALSYPLSPPESSIAGRGLPVIFAAANVPANTEIVIGCPANRRFILRACRLDLTTSAIAGNRNVLMTIDDGVVGDSPFFAPAGAVQGPSTTVTYNWGHGLTAAALPQQQAAGLPFELSLLPGWRIRFTWLNQGAGDVLSNCWALWEQFISP